jgi:hypothetical protein
MQGRHFVFSSACYRATSLDCSWMSQLGRNRQLAKYRSVTSQGCAATHVALVSLGDDRIKRPVCVEITNRYL